MVRGSKIKKGYEQLNVTMYTTHCAKCKLLTIKLERLIKEGFDMKIDEVTDVELMKEKGFTTVPMLEVNGEIMDFSKANKWANDIKEENTKNSRGNK